MIKDLGWDTLKLAGRKGQINACIPRKSQFD